MLIAIDGTESKKMLGSNVHDFYNRYQGPKRYYHGPDLWITGHDLWDSVRAGFHFVEWNLRSLGPGDPAMVIDLIGHSRGGMGVIVLAQRLHEAPRGSIPVRFLGLYDAVDRTPTLAFGTIPPNVRNVRHAVRSRAVGSRTFFGNTGTSWDGAPRGWKRAFAGSHAAIGGDPWNGDHPEGLSEVQDRRVARQVQGWMIHQARDLGVPVA